MNYSEFVAIDLRFCARICTLPLGLLAYATLCAPPRPCSCDNFALQMKNAKTGISENFTSCLVSNPPLIRAFVALIHYDSTSSAMFQLLHFLFHFALQPYSQYSVGPTSYASTSPKVIGTSRRDPWDKDRIKYRLLMIYRFDALPPNTCYRNK